MPPITPKEIESAINKFRRYLTEARALECDEAKIEAFTERVEATIEGIFGENSDYRLFLLTPPLTKDDAKNRRRLSEHIAEIIEELESTVLRLHQQHIDTCISVLEALNIHPIIRKACLDLFGKGLYRHAVLDASIALCEMVRRKSGCRDRDGADLMRYVFSKSSPLLACNGLATDSERSEQEGIMHLFEGAIQAIRNPRAHGLSADEPESAMDYIALLSFLAKRLESAKAREKSPLAQ
jgi:uncharacterized protein (TIGR02391 family)